MRKSGVSLAVVALLATARCGDRPAGPVNGTPVAVAGADQSGKTGEVFTLDGSGSSVRLGVPADRRSLPPTLPARIRPLRP